MVQIIATALLLLAAVQASPVYRRQEVSSVASDLSASASDVASDLSASASSLVASTSAASALPSSAVDSASASASASAAPEYPGYPCVEGLLTYVEVSQAYPGVPLQVAVDFLSNWAAAVPYPIVNSTGTNETGATRTYTVAGLDISEVLVNQTIDPLTGALSSDSNITTPISQGGLTIYSAANNLAYYTNETTSESTGKVFSNFCASDQAAGIAAFEALLQGTLAAYGSLLSGSGAASSGVASSGVSAVSSAASSAASSLGESIASGPSSILESATSAASAGIPLASSGGGGVSNPTATL